MSVSSALDEYRQPTKPSQNPGWNMYGSGVESQGRDGRPEEIAATAAHLASEDAGYINGHVLNVDGGYHASGLDA